MAENDISIHLPDREDVLKQPESAPKEAAPETTKRLSLSELTESLSITRDILASSGLSKKDTSVVIAELLFPGHITGTGSAESPWQGSTGGDLEKTLSAAAGRLVMGEVEEGILAFNEEVVAVRIGEDRQGEKNLQIDPLSGIPQRRFFPRRFAKKGHVQAFADTIEKDGIETYQITTENERTAVADNLREAFDKAREDQKERDEISLSTQLEIWQRVGQGLLAEGLQKQQQGETPEELKLAVDAAVIMKGLQAVSDITPKLHFAESLMHALHGNNTLAAELLAVYEGTIHIESASSEANRWYAPFKPFAEAMHAAKIARKSAQLMSETAMYNFVEKFAGEPGTQTKTSGENGGVMTDVIALAGRVEENGLTHLNPPPEVW